MSFNSKQRMVVESGRKGPARIMRLALGILFAVGVVFIWGFVVFVAVAFSNQPLQVFFIASQIGITISFLLAYALRFSLESRTLLVFAVLGIAALLLWIGGDYRYDTNYPGFLLDGSTAIFALSTTALAFLAFLCLARGGAEERNRRRAQRLVPGPLAKILFFTLLVELVLLFFATRVPSAP